MNGAEYGYVGKGKRIHIVRSGTTTYCERTISKPVADPEQVSPEELCQTCWTRREEVGVEESAPGPSASPAGGEEAVPPQEEPEPARAEREEAPAVEPLDRMFSLCEERLGGFCAPVLLGGIAVLAVVAIGILLAVGLIRVLILLVLVGGGGYAYLRLTGQMELWDRFWSRSARLLSDFRARIRAMLS
ncbi:MAG TPA: hypothetical protein VKA48_07760 [Gammaproteobacteria bacterium]|nr:hypothetical protein [Gammaproteobacteria bacterium]